jgi:hypothetical protein
MIVDPTTELLISFVMLALAGLLAMTLVIGTLVAIQPHWLDRLRQRADRRISMRRATRAFDVPRNIDPLFYRHHRAYGGIVVVLAIFLLYFLVFGHVRAGLEAPLGIDNDIAAEILANTARVVLWVGAIFALIIGTVVFVRPSALKGFERWANRWLTPRRLTRSTQRAYYPLERGVAAHPRAWGSAVATISLICLIALYIQWRLSALGG